jgi:hypothetical protein
MLSDEDLNTYIIIMLALMVLEVHVVFSCFAFKVIFFAFCCKLKNEVTSPRKPTFE